MSACEYIWDLNGDINLAALKPDPGGVVFAHSFLCIFIATPTSYLHFMEEYVRIH